MDKFNKIDKLDEWDKMLAQRMIDDQKELERLGRSDNENPIQQRDIPVWIQRFCVVGVLTVLLLLFVDTILKGWG